MDVSQEYIKMVDCEEIQVPHWEKGWSEGDYFWDGKKVCFCGMDYLQVKNLFLDGRNRVRFAMREPMAAIVYEQPSPLSAIAMKTGDYEIVTLNNALWLLRQDQLQEMLGEEYPINLLYDFRHFYNMKADYPHQFISMEQLWLAFVMKEKHSKTWDGDKWVVA